VRAAHRQEGQERARLIDDEGHANTVLGDDVALNVDRDVYVSA
jgi:hypothetical protein